MPKPFLFKCLTLLLFATLPLSASAQPIRVPEGQVLSLRLETPANTVAVGDVEVADARVAFRDVIVVVAKSTGVTNVIAYDVEGNEIFSEELIVTAIEETTRVDIIVGENRRVHTCWDTHCDEQREPDRIYRSGSSTDVSGETERTTTIESFTE